MYFLIFHAYYSFTYFCSNNALFNAVSPVSAVEFISILYSNRHFSNSSNSSAECKLSTAICKAFAPVILLQAFTLAP